MDKINGKSLLIGRDPSKSCLMVTVMENGKSGILGNPGSVPSSVSRCRPAEGTAHARIEINNKGAITIFNLNPGNSTFVDGNEVSVKRINHDSIVQLGCDRYLLDLKTIIDAITKLVPPAPMDISHLQDVWEKYQSETDRLNLAQQNMAKKKMLPIMVSSSSGILSALGAAINLSTLWVSLPVTAIVSALYFRNYYSKDTIPEEKKAVADEFYDNWVCPSCGHSFNARNYEHLKRNLRNPKDNKMYCPTCKCELIEK